MPHPSVYRRCASEVEAQLPRVRRQLNAALACEDWRDVALRETEIEMLLERAARFRRLALVAAAWPYLVMLAVGLLVAALAALTIWS